jgi:hypothetical protein
VLGLQLHFALEGGVLWASLDGLPGIGGGLPDVA